MFSLALDHLDKGGEGGGVADQSLTSHTMRWNIPYLEFWNLRISS